VSLAAKRFTMSGWLIGSVQIRHPARQTPDQHSNYNTLVALRTARLRHHLRPSAIKKEDKKKKSTLAVGSQARTCWTLGPSTVLSQPCLIGLPENFLSREEMPKPRFANSSREAHRSRFAVRKDTVQTVIVREQISKVGPTMTEDPKCEPPSLVR